MEERAIFRMDFEGSDKILEQMARIRDANDNLKKNQKELSEAAKAGNLEAAKSFEANRVQMGRNNKEIRELTKVYDEGTKEQQKRTGSLVEMRKQLRQMVTAYDNLSQEQRENTDTGKQMKEGIAGLTEELKEAEGATGRHQRNVGNYEEAINTAGMGIYEMRQQLMELKKVSQEDLSPEQVQKLESAMGQLTDATEKANARIKVQSMDDIPALVASLQGVVAASQLVVGSMALFGVEDERVKKLTQTMVQLVGVSQSLATINQLIASGQAAALAVRMKTLALTSAQAVATKAQAAAQWILNTATMAFPLTWLIAGFAALIGGVTLLIRNLETVGNWFRRVGEWMGIVAKETEQVNTEKQKLVETIEKEIESLNSLSIASGRMQDDMKKEIELMKAKGDDIDSIRAKERELILEQINAAKIRIQLAGMEAKQLQQSDRFMDRALGKVNEKLVAYSDEQKELDKLIHQLNVFDVTQERVQRESVERQREAANERIKQQQNNAAREEQELQDRLRRSEKATLELAVIQAKSEEERIAARIELLRWETQQRLDNEKLTQEELLLIEAESIEKQLDLENILLQRELDQQREFDELQKERMLELDDFESALIEDKKQRQEAQLAFEKDITEARIDSAFNLLFALQNIGGEESKLAKAAKILQKGLALVDIGINLQRELAAIRVAAAVQDAIIPGSGRLFATVRRIQALSQAAGGAASVLALNKGGMIPGKGSRDTVPVMATPGEGMMREQAMSANDVWNLSGTPKQIASHLNQAYGGVEFRNQGGIIGGTTARTSTRNAASELNNESLKEAFREITIVTTIEDVNAKISSEAMRNEIATYG